MSSQDRNRNWRVTSLLVLAVLGLSSCSSGGSRAAAELTGPTVSAEEAFGVHPIGVSMVPSRAGVLLAVTGTRRAPRLARCDAHARCQRFGDGKLTGYSVTLSGATADGGPILLASRCTTEGPDCASDEFAVQAIDDGSGRLSISEARWFTSATVAEKGGADERLHAEVWRVRRRRRLRRR